MTPHRRGRSGAGLWALVTLAALLLPARTPARAADTTLQVSPEVSTAFGGDAVTLTATVSPSGSAPGTTVDFAIEGNGPAIATAQNSQCTVPAQKTTCQVAIRGDTQGTSLVRASIHGSQVDGSEARLANTGTPVGGLVDVDPAADCRVADGSASTCNPSGTQANQGDIAEPDGTDVVQITWTTFVDAHLNCDDAKPGDGTDVEYNNSAANPPDRTETYTCTLTDLSGTPINGAFIDGEILSGPGPKASSGNQADFNDFCQTGTDGPGRCHNVVTIDAPAVGATTICFWGEPGARADNRYDANGSNIDGGGCKNELVEEPENNNITDSVLLDTGPPRASGLDVQPENQYATPGSRFSLTAIVYDQFGQVFRGNGTDTTVNGEFFSGSPLDQDGNTPSSADLHCTTGTQGACSIPTATQTQLGPDLACFWIAVAGTQPPQMIGDNFGGQCADEILTDPTADDGVPSPPIDGRDIVRFTVRSNPGIFTVAPTQLRQDAGDVLVVTGVNFLDTARVTVSGSGIELGPTTVVSASRLEARINVDPDAPPGRRDVTVTNGDGGTTTCGACFTAVGQGYWLVASDGGIFSFGDAPFAGSAGGKPINKPIVGMAPTPSGLGYWLVASDGGIFNYGDAGFLGSAAGVTLNQPIVGMAPTPSGRGYWLVASDGGIFAYGDARFFGSTGRLPLTRPIVGIAASPSGKGYWLVGSDGGVFAFGDARFFGSTGDVRLNQPIVAMAATKTGKGYWLVASDGGIFSFADATFYGGTGDMKLNRPIVTMATTPLGKGYWLVASDGGIFAFGDARFSGSTGAVRLNQAIVGAARR
jgi:hypothetical protein